jgi:hypothetical protein
MKRTRDLETQGGGRKAVWPDAAYRACGFRANGSMHPDVDADNEPSRAMRTLMIRRRVVNASALTPRAIVGEIARSKVLEAMFHELTLERWMRCDSWRAWELMDWFPPDERVDGFATTASVQVVRAGYPDGEWWGGRCYPREWIRHWLAKGYRRPQSAWDDEELVGRFAPELGNAEMAESIVRVEALLRAARAPVVADAEPAELF